MAQSTFINHAITTQEQLKNWILRKLGYPLITVELTDDQLNDIINDSFELYTKFASFDEKYLIINLQTYVKGTGIDLSQYNIGAIYGLENKSSNMMGQSSDMIWTIPNALLQSGAYPGFGAAGMGGSFVTVHSAYEWIAMAQRITASKTTFTYDRYSKMMKLIPEPLDSDKNFSVLLTCEIIPPDAVLYGNEYVKRLCIANAKVLLGIIRKKFANVQLPGGGNIDTDIGEEGKADLEKLIEDIRSSESRGTGFICG